MEAFASTDDDSPLMLMFEELMAKAIDKRESDKLSPAFPKIIRDLSPLQAKLIAALMHETHITDDLLKEHENLIVKRIHANFRFEDFGGHAHHLTISQDLKEKNITAINQNARFDVAKTYPSLTVPHGLAVRRTTIRLTMFGHWFATACIRKP